MAVLYIAEYASVANNANSEVPKAPLLASQTLQVTGVQTSAAFNDQTQLIEIHTDAVCFILIGAAPTATQTSMRMAAGETRRYGVTPGHKISVISAT